MIKIIAAKPTIASGKLQIFRFHQICFFFIQLEPGLHKYKPRRRRNDILNSNKCTAQNSMMIQTSDVQIPACKDDSKTPPMQEDLCDTLFGYIRRLLYYFLKQKLADHWLKREFFNVGRLTRYLRSTMRPTISIAQIVKPRSQLYIIGRSRAFDKAGSYNSSKGNIIERKDQDGLKTCYALNIGRKKMKCNRKTGQQLIQ